MGLKMGKRSDFERNPRDFYPTPLEAVVPLIPHLHYAGSFAEPCAGDGSLIRHVEELDKYIACALAWDIEPQANWIEKRDAFELRDMDSFDCIITNPPWSRDVLHLMIDHFRNIAPTWLLIDADWAYTKQAKPYLKYCSDIVVVGRVKWIPESKMTGKDNCAWYQFQKEEEWTRFHA